MYGERGRYRCMEEVKGIDVYYTLYRGMGRDRCMEEGAGIDVWRKGGRNRWVERGGRNRWVERGIDGDGGCHGSTTVPYA